MSHCEWCVKWLVSVSDTPAVSVESSPRLVAGVGTTENIAMQVMSSPLAQMRCGIQDASAVMRVGILCMAGQERWLEVMPEEHAWLTEANGWSFDYEVMSNLQWEVVASKVRNSDFSNDFNGDFAIEINEFNDDYNNDFR